MLNQFQLTHQETEVIASSLASEKARIENLLAKFSAPSTTKYPISHQMIVAQTTTSHVPEPGQLWPKQGGIYAGALAALDGQGIEHLVLGDWIDRELEWGSYGKDTPGTSSRTDGKANTAAMLAAQSSAATAVEKRNTSAGDFSDWHIPSQQEAQLIAATCFDEMDKALIWTSTQYSARHAWCQSFNIGSSTWDYKHHNLRVRLVRRLFL